MNISDLTYLEAATEANTVEGGILSYQTGSFFAQRYQYVGALSSSSAGGTVAGGTVVDVLTLTGSGLSVLF